jgi:hypothetical protein
VCAMQRVVPNAVYMCSHPPVTLHQPYGPRAPLTHASDIGICSTRGPSVPVQPPFKVPLSRQRHLMLSSLVDVSLKK